MKKAIAKVLAVIGAIAVGLSAFALAIYADGLNRKAYMEKVQQATAEVYYVEMLADSRQQTVPCEHGGDFLIYVVRSDNRILEYGTACIDATKGGSTFIYVPPTPIQ